MITKNIYEVFDEFKTATNRASRVKVLQDNNSFALRNVLIGTFHPGVKFVFDKIPDYKSEEVPAGMSYNNITKALDTIYLFMENNPRVAPTLTLDRKKELLIQTLESLEPREAEVYANIILKDQKIPYLTEALVREAFPTLLPKSI